jgi:transketolase
MFRSLPGSTVFYPSDAVSTERSVELAANTKGITFIRVARPATAVLYDNDEVFEVTFTYMINSPSHFFFSGVLKVINFL